MAAKHITFEPLILPKKTPAEELREIVRRINIAPNYETRESLEGLAARLEAPDEPKRWDGVFPWVRKTLDRVNPVVCFGETLAFYPGSNDVKTEPLAANFTAPYHDGVIITITAGDGTEFPRMMRTTEDRIVHFLIFSVKDRCASGVAMTSGEITTAGEVDGCWDMPQLSPLHPGTVTRITISNHGATTEQRYSVEVVEPEKVEDWLPVEPVGRYLRLDRHADSDKLELQYRNGKPIIDIDGFCAAELRDCLTRWLDESRTDPPEEQPATEVAAERLPLTLRNQQLKSSMTIEKSMYIQGGLHIFVEEGQDIGAIHIHLTPADESRLRNLLNQRAKGGGV